MANQLKNMLIGLFVVIGCFLIVGTILFIKPSVGDGKQIIKVRFSNINGINIGTPVTYAGKPIGEVASIQQVVDARLQGVNQYGQVYPYLLTLKLDSSYSIFKSDEITVQTQGLLGEKYVAIIPKALKQGETAIIITPKDVTFAESSDLLESVMNEFSSVSERLEQTLTKVMNWIDKYGDTLGGAIKTFDVTLKQICKAVGDFNNLGVMHDVKDAVANFAATFGEIYQIIYRMDQDQFFNSLTQTINHFNQITDRIAKGQGTLGRIIEEDGLYLQINALMTKTNTLLNDINQYGLLFQYNKEWQRKRIQLMAEADRISNPKAFQAYMNQEIDQINTTLERMSELTNHFDTQELIRNQNFKNTFKEFLSQLQDLQEKVNLYNQELFKAQQEGSYNECKSTRSP